MLIWKSCVLRILVLPCETQVRFCSESRKQITSSGTAISMLPIIFKCGTDSLLTGVDAAFMSLNLLSEKIDVGQHLIGMLLLYLLSDKLKYNTLLLLFGWLVVAG